MPELQGTHEELIGLLEDAEASEKSVHATVQMLRLLAMPTRDIQQAFLSGRELCVQNHLKLARMAAQGAAQHACRAQDFAASGKVTEWQDVHHFLETLGSNVFPRVHGVRCLQLNIRSFHRLYHRMFNVYVHTLPLPTPLCPPLRISYLCYTYILSIYYLQHSIIDLERCSHADAGGIHRGVWEPERGLIFT